MYLWSSSHRSCHSWSSCSLWASSQRSPSWQHSSATFTLHLLRFSFATPRGGGRNFHLEVAPSPSPDILSVIYFEISPSLLSSSGVTGENLVFQKSWSGIENVTKYSLWLRAQTDREKSELTLFNKIVLKSDPWWPRDPGQASQSYHDKIMIRLSVADWPGFVCCVLVMFVCPGDV